MSLSSKWPELLEEQGYLVQMLSEAAYDSDLRSCTMQVAELEREKWAVPCYREHRLIVGCFSRDSMGKHHDTKFGASTSRIYHRITDSLGYDKDKEDDRHERLLAVWTKKRTLSMQVKNLEVKLWNQAQLLKRRTRHYEELQRRLATIYAKISDGKTSPSREETEAEEEARRAQCTLHETQKIVDRHKILTSLLTHGDRALVNAAHHLNAAGTSRSSKELDAAKKCALQTSIIVDQANRLDSLFFNENGVEGLNTGWLADVFHPTSDGPRPALLLQALKPHHTALLFLISVARKKADELHVVVHRAAYRCSEANSRQDALKRRALEARVNMASDIIMEGWVGADGADDGLESDGSAKMREITTGLDNVISIVVPTRQPATPDPGRGEERGRGGQVVPAFGASAVSENLSKSRPILVTVLPSGGSTPGTLPQRVSALAEANQSGADEERRRAGREAFGTHVSPSPPLAQPQPRLPLQSPMSQILAVPTPSPDGSPTSSPDPRVDRRGGVPAVPADIKPRKALLVDRTSRESSPQRAPLPAAGLLPEQRVQAGSGSNPLPPSSARSQVQAPRVASSTPPLQLKPKPLPQSRPQPQPQLQPQGQSRSQPPPQLQPQPTSRLSLQPQPQPQPQSQAQSQPQPQPQTLRQPQAVQDVHRTRSMCTTPPFKSLAAPNSNLGPDARLQAPISSANINSVSSESTQRVVSARGIQSRQLRPQISIPPVEEVITTSSNKSPLENKSSSVSHVRPRSMELQAPSNLSRPSKPYVPPGDAQQAPKVVPRIPVPRAPTRSILKVPPNDPSPQFIPGDGTDAWGGVKAASAASARPQPKIKAMFNKWRSVESTKASGSSSSGARVPTPSDPLPPPPPQKPNPRTAMQKLRFMDGVEIIPRPEADSNPYEDEEEEEEEGLPPSPRRGSMVWIREGEDGSDEGSFERGSDVEPPSSVGAPSTSVSAVIKERLAQKTDQYPTSSPSSTFSPFSGSSSSLHSYYTTSDDGWTTSTLLPHSLSGDSDDARLHGADERWDGVARSSWGRSSLAANQKTKDPRSTDTSLAQGSSNHTLIQTIFPSPAQSKLSEHDLLLSP
ncbi:hypothetical protein K439DRAFT_1621734 [Ramaria rubella]|nr:hypothetical protein K439DRAFT_1621734 [Ramaria rubella]